MPIKKTFWALLGLRCSGKCLTFWAAIEEDFFWILLEQPLHNTQFEGIRPIDKKLFDDWIR